MNEEYYIVKENKQWIMYVVTEYTINMVARSSFLTIGAEDAEGLTSIYTIEYAYSDHLDVEDGWTAKAILLNECEIAAKISKKFTYKQISERAAKKILFLIRL